MDGVSVSCQEAIREATVEERFPAGDPHAFTEIHDRFAAPMFATALALLGDRELAAEAVQAAFIRAWQAAGSFDPRRELRPWLYAIVRRTAVDVYRRHRRHAVTVPLDLVDERRLVAGGPQPTAAAERVRAALEAIPAEERAVVYLAYFDSLTQAEIATTLNIPVGTVKSRTARAHRRLAGLLCPPSMVNSAAGA